MRYHTGVPIGEGGMGAVVRAFDPVLGRHVALKILRHDDPELAARMLAEARAQAAVDHPNVAAVHEVGYLEDGRPFIAMQLVEGRPLDQVAPPLTLEQRLRLVVTVAEAVHAAHCTGLVHRDLKPANILVEESADGLQPFVLDFGIARMEHATGLTVTGQVVGTPGYMAPEQAAGSIHAIDRRADVFTLGIILYELVAGTHPFRGDSAVQRLMSILRDEPEPLRRRCPDAPADLEAIVACCLEKSPARRYATARALAEDLRRFLAGEPVLARRVTGVDRALRLARRHSRVATVVGVSLLAVLVALSLLVVSRVESRSRERLAQDLGRKVEGIDATMRAARLLPRHDLTREKQRVRSDMEQIRGQLPRLRGATRGAAHLALGRGHLALSEVVEARHALDLAWADGERSAAHSSASARAHAELYRRALQRIQGIRDETARAEALAAVEREHRRPAERALERARGLGADPDPLVEGLLALASDPDALVTRALELAARPSTPAEEAAQAALLAGEATLQRAQQQLSGGDLEAHDENVRTAVRWFERALEVGRSDPAAALGLCRARSLATEGAAEGGREVDEPRAMAEQACDEALGIDPELWFAHLARGRAAIAVAQQRLRRGEDAGEPLAAARQAAAAVRDLGGDACEAELLDGFALINLADAARYSRQPNEAILEEAVTRFRAASAADPQRPEPFHMRGNALTLIAFERARQGVDATAELEEACAAFAEALERPGGTARHTLNSLGLAQLELAFGELGRGADPGNRARKAERALDHAIAIAPGYVSAWGTLGQVHWVRAEYLALTGGNWQGPFDEGVRCFSRVLELDPARVAGRINLIGMAAALARVLARRGEDPTSLVEVASPHLEGLRTAAPWDWRVSSAILELAVAQWAVGRGQAADDSLGRARAHGEWLIRETPEDSEGYRIMAEAARVRLEAAASATAVDHGRLAAVAEEGLGHVAAALERNPSLGAAHAHRAAFELTLARLTADPAEAEARRTAADDARRTARRLEPLLHDPVLDQGGPR